MGSPGSDGENNQGQSNNQQDKDGSAKVAHHFHTVRANLGDNVTRWGAFIRPARLWQTQLPGPPRQLPRAKPARYFPPSTVAGNARLAKLVDARDLKSLGWQRPCRFESGSGH